MSYDMSTTLKILKLRQKQTYLNGLIDGMEELEKHMNKHYLSDSEVDSDFSTMLYVANDELFSNYIYRVEEIDREIEELEKEEANV